MSASPQTGTGGYAFEIKLAAMIVVPLVVVVGGLAYLGGSSDRQPTAPAAPAVAAPARSPAAPVQPPVRGAPLAAPVEPLEADRPDTPPPSGLPFAGGSDFRQRDPSTLNPETASQDAPPAESGGGYRAVTFKQLASYRYPRFGGGGEYYAIGEPTDAAEPAAGDEEAAAADEAEPADKIPAEVRALNGQPVAVSGFMLPIEVRQGKVMNFMLVRNQLGCCFGVPLELNEWIDVKMADGKGTQYIADVPIAVRGQLEVGEESIDGWVLSIYRMQAEDVRPLAGY